MIHLVGSRGIPARYGGFETLVQRLNDDLSVRGHEVQVVGTRDHDVSQSFWGRLISRTGFRSLETPLLTWMFRPDVEPGDAVLVVNPINVWTAKNLARRGARVWLHMDGMEHERRKWGFVARSAHRLARRTAARSTLGLVVDSSAIARLYQQEFGVEPMCIGYGGCVTAELDPEHRWDPNPESNVFLVVARPEPENNILEICQAFSRTTIDARLMVVGAPPHSTRYWREVEAAAASDRRVTLFAPIWDREALCSLYRECSAVIHGHSAGGTNPSLVDALSHGTPVLAHDNPFNRETTSDSALYWSNEGDLHELLEHHGAEAGQLPVPEAPRHLHWVHVLQEYEELLCAQ